MSDRRRSEDSRHTHDYTGRRIRVYCGSGNVRCWFTVHGMVGVRAPVCQHGGCNRENPRPLTPDEWANYEAVRRV